MRIFVAAAVALLALGCGGEEPPVGTVIQLASTGKLVGLVYKSPNTADRIVGAKVTLSGGKSTTSGSTGYWEFTLSAGTYNYTVSKAGFKTAKSSRTVTAGQTTWGSIGLSPASTLKDQGVAPDKAGPSPDLGGAPDLAGGAKDQAAGDLGGLDLPGAGGADQGSGGFKHLDEGCAAGGDGAAGGAGFGLLLCALLWRRRLDKRRSR